MDNRYQETYNTWNKVAGLYQKHFMDFDLYNDSYDAFCNSIVNMNASILEIGCGPGNITRQLIKRRPDYRITAIDVSLKMIELAQKNVHGVAFEVMDCRALGEISNQFDGIICGFTIPYLSPPDLSKLIYDCSHLLGDKGSLYLSFVSGDPKKSGFISGSTGDRTYFYYYDPDEIMKTLEKNSLLISDITEVDYKRNDGQTEVHTIILAMKRSAHKSDR